ncbi:MAG: TIGR00282 family metallophosphoesterase [Candidatus Kerfeldbacteria bacterium CG_4_10_14_0_8_um_filter_42_10]|uniref:TIGR00282 family metallophosphoesterase n=1 Tax=Candidatus Kerfeldbacteria bacterium CG_4_10_14_0_8_um_filter_42_10 TaxID=2014248 RepID=A0A2M7RJG5_9BACT|nr:MAG: TIGR00282 family metallophosphoesterase [Candidatus Kerfeldbacteria bacterium CG_4_10_14_0_8_um_filter_42_10]
MELKILFFGDIVGKIGRKAIRLAIPILKKRYGPDLIIANIENLAHGKGITEKTLNEVKESGIDIFTSGNHIFKREEGLDLLANKDSLVIRPANYPEGTAGYGEKLVEIGTKKLLVINLIGRVFFEEDFDSPFKKLDEILETHTKDDLSGIIIDFHAEATSEKVALGWYADGRVSAVLGTHTHIPTADAKILPKGTAYITDIGMVGPKESVLGVKKEIIIEKFLKDLPIIFDIPEEGIVQINAVLITIDTKTKKAKKIELIDQEISI